MICISVVSHGQMQLLQALLDDLEKYCANDVSLILTVNVPEEKIDISRYHFPIKIIDNTHPKGFGENHNAAFKLCELPYFCVLNPDIRLLNNPFILLIKHLENKNTGVVGPSVVDEQGNVQDSARKFMNIKELLKRIFISQKEITPDNYPDWIAGMFMLFKKETYQAINGFDEGYFLYCEDMDLCARLQEKFYTVRYDPSIKVVHAAQRSSHKKIRYLLWHLKSLVRFLHRYYFHFRRTLVKEVKA